MDTATDVANQIVGDVMEQGEVNASADEGQETESQDQEQEQLSESEDGAQTSEETQEETTEENEQEQQETDEEGSTDKTKKPSKSEEGQDPIVQEAVKSLEGILGRKLSEDEAVVAMAESHVNATHKIESLTEQIKDLVPYREQYEQLMADPNIVNYINGIPADSAGSQEDGGEALDPEVKALKGQVAELTRKLNDRENSDVQQRWLGDVKKCSEGYDRLAAKDNEFAKLRSEYQTSLRTNRYAKPPAKLARMTALVNGGLSAGLSVDEAIGDAWNVVNKDKAENKFKRKIAAEQLNKTKKLGINKKPVAQAPKKKYSDAGSASELVEMVVNDAYEET